MGPNFPPDTFQDKIVTQLTGEKGIVGFKIVQEGGKW